jgi:hypothetical protein
MHEIVEIVKEKTKATTLNTKKWPSNIPLLGQVGCHFPQVLKQRPKYF